MDPVKYIHIADLHLGKKQYNLEERYRDYFEAFKWILELSIKEEVDFILISGDLFDNKKIGPSVLSEVYNIVTDFQLECNKRLKRDIKIICIEGNHDNPIYSSQSWMSFLADLGLIILLNGQFDKNSKKVSFQKYSHETRRGGTIQIKDCNIYGLPYYGSFTENLFPSIYNEINSDSSKFNILMMHFGVQGYDKKKPGIEISDNLKKLGEKIDYLALGHYHRSFSYPASEPWIFNPGSLETTDIFEIPSLQYPRGAIICNITGKEFYKRNIRPIACDNGASDPHLIPNRRFYSMSSIDIGSTNSFDQAIDMIVQRVRNYNIPLKKNNPNFSREDLDTMILVFSIKGEIKYSRLEINLNKLRKKILDEFALLDVRTYSKDLYSSLDTIKTSGTDLTIDEIEREIFLALVEENQKFSPIKEKVLGLMDDLKTELTDRKPNYSKLRNQIKEWVKLNIKDFESIEEVFSTYQQEEEDKEKLFKIINQPETEAKDKDGIEGFELSDDDEFDDIDLDLYIDDGEEEDEESDFEVF